MIHDYSGFEGLSLEQFPDEEPGPGEVRLRIEAFALNWGDMDLMEDRYSYSFAGDLSPNVDRVYALEDYVDACRYMKEPRRAHGKVVIETGVR